ncbi:hypothetical protein GE107_17860 [Cohnella sp. CFH 77786]|uniref:DUF4380 domain-containing protein n=1 Tax=Cohnella sp. CFH 77786 TaxID=2662265 RepID=UPI001C60EB66|nr:DUF4380 domain-containing protein [Cohnella sp. CFH 77786]MBW5447923.1 hypothetical protein [Cohnella sp. CFH 77786]
MAKVTSEVIRHERWGRCVSIGNGSVELLATLDFGPRIIHLSSAGGSNLFYEDSERKIADGGEAFAPVGGGSWHLYGGHRLWTSPERVPRTTYPDNEPVEWEPAGENGIVLRAPRERWNQVTKEIELRLSPDGPTVQVVHRVTNNGAWPIHFAPWALSVMSTGGRAVVPMTGTDTGLLPNRRLIHWPYNRLNDPRITFTESELIVDQGDGPTPYKIGTDNEAGWAAYSNHGDTFIKRYRPVPGGSYPDFGVSFEMYTNSFMLELETLGEFREVESGETVVHEETWQVVAGLDLKQGGPSEAVSLLEPYLKG